MCFEFVRVGRRRCRVQTRLAVNRKFSILPAAGASAHAQKGSQFVQGSGLKTDKEKRQGRNEIDIQRPKGWRRDNDYIHTAASGDQISGVESFGFYIINGKGTFFLSVGSMKNPGTSFEEW